jgi:hypothetical protein
MMIYSGVARWERLEEQKQRIRMDLVGNCEIQIKTINIHRHNSCHLYTGKGKGKVVRVLN